MTSPASARITHRGPSQDTAADSQASPGEELRRSEERFRLLVESVGDYAICMLDPTGRVTTWNLGAERMTGFSVGEIIGRHFDVFFPAEDIARGKPERELAIARAEGRFQDDGWRVRKDGTPFWANVVVTALRDGRGELRGFAKITRDLTSQREAEETEWRLLRERAARAAAEEGERRLHESEERYRRLNERLELILEGVADGITVQDRDGRILFANHAAARLCGYSSREQLLAATPAELADRFELHDEAGSPIDLESLPGRRVFLGEASMRTLLRVRDRISHREWWSLVRSNRVLGADGAEELAINIWHDVTTERRRAAHERHLSGAAATLSSSLEYGSMLSKLARFLVPGLADWVSIRLLEGGELRSVAVAHVDPARQELAEEYQRLYPPERRHDRGLWSVVRTGRSELHEAISLETLARGAHDERQLAMLRELGLSSMVAAPVRIRDHVSGVITLVTAESNRHYDEIDVAFVEELGRRAGAAIENAMLYSAEKKAREQASEAAKRAEEASRIKDEFLATVSHELRTPLNAIVGWSSLLRDRSADPSIMKGVSVIHRNAEAQARIIEDILDVSRIITGKLRLELQPTALVQIVRESIEVVRPSASAKEITIALEQAPELPTVVVDRERVQQVVWNLLSNSVKFTEPGGAITIRLHQEGPSLATKERGEILGSLIIDVTDTGRGIEPEFLPYVFDRFKQGDSSTTRRFGGLGLGLAIVRHIVELHGGHVEATSEGRAKGATFRVTLPVRATTASAETPQQRATSSDRGSGRGEVPSLHGVRALVVDDELDARELLQMVLVQAGATVETAGSAADGFEALVRFRPHILVSDIGMPEEDGYSFMQRVRAEPELGKSLPAIALTAYTRGEDKAKALAVGFTTHIGKPVNPDDLVTTVAKLVAT